MVVILVVGLTHQSLYCTTDMVRRRLWSSAPGSCSLLFGTWGWLTWWVSCGDVRLRLGRRWTRHKKRLTSYITARRRHFSASYRHETEIPDVCCCSRYSGTKAHTAQVSRAQGNGNQPTTAIHRDRGWSQQRWIMDSRVVQFRTTAPPETFISAPKTKHETADQLRNAVEKTTIAFEGSHWNTKLVIDSTRQL